MRLGLMVLLTGVLACADQPTLAGGTADRPAGRLFFLRGQTLPDVGTNGRLHVTTDAVLRSAVPTATAPGAQTAQVRATPDGRFLAWWVDGRILTMDRFEGTIGEVTPPGGYRDGQFAWYPGGADLLVQRTRPDGLVQYVRVARDGSRTSPLPLDTTFARINSLDLSPDGTELLIVRNDYRLPPYLVRLADGVTQPITFERPDFHTLQHVRWSPDGSRFLAFEWGPSAGRWVVRGRDGTLLATREQTVVGSAPQATRAVWSPDGSQVAVCEWVEQVRRYSFPTGRNGIVLWTVSSGAEDVLTPAGVEDCWPEWTR